MKKERIQWIDNMRGLAVVLVLLSHTSHIDKLQLTLLAMFMIPSFFLISGYLTKYDGKDVFDFFYNRVFKLFLVYVAYVFLLPFLSVSEMTKISHKPSLIIEKIIGSCRALVFGNRMWFVACLIIVNIIFMIIRKISHSSITLLIISIAIACVGFGISFIIGGKMHPWSADTALVCQLFFTIGYILRKIERSEWYKNPLAKTIITGSIYVGVVLIIWYLFDYSLIYINVAGNVWGKLWLTIPLILLSLYSGLCSSRLFTKLKLFPFWGQNSLIYFAIGSHGTSVINKLFEFLYQKYGFAILSNRSIINPISAFLGAVILVPAVWIINRYAPFFNGRYKLPNIKKS